MVGRTFRLGAVILLAFLNLTSSRITVFINWAHTDDRIDANRNLEFFLKHGVSVSIKSGHTIHYGVTINGNCTNFCCMDPRSYVRQNDVHKKIHLEILRRENIGFDFGAHGAMLSHLDKEGRNYMYYIFLNCGVAGPIKPSYMPESWHWSSAFTDRLQKGIGLVGVSIACLYEEDLGGYGPKVEGFAFALSAAAKDALYINNTVFVDHKDKSAAILQGEYGLTKTLLKNHFKIDCLLTAYQGVDWSDRGNWDCNANIHPSRQDSYYDISMHPLETLFHKSRWGGGSVEPSVNEDVLDNYIAWLDRDKRSEAPKLVGVPSSAPIAAPVDCNVIRGYKRSKVYNRGDHVVYKGYAYRAKYNQTEQVGYWSKRWKTLGKC